MRQSVVPPAGLFRMSLQRESGNRGAATWALEMLVIEAI
jgi:hypothetical protein